MVAVEQEVSLMKSAASCFRRGGGDKPEGLRHGVTPLHHSSSSSLWLVSGCPHQNRTVNMSPKPDQSGFLLFCSRPHGGAAGFPPSVKLFPGSCSETDERLDRTDSFLTVWGLVLVLWVQRSSCGSSGGSLSSHRAYGGGFGSGGSGGSEAEVSVLPLAAVSPGSHSGEEAGWQPLPVCRLTFDPLAAVLPVS